MDELLKQALYLTVVGMGMTFLAIGALVASMYLMTAFTQDRPAEGAAQVEETPPTTPQDSQDSDRNERHLAAAAAVAVALATQPAAAVATSSATADWSAYIRGRHLSARQQYEARKCR